MMNPLLAFGARPAGERLARVLRSPNFQNDKFHNPVETLISAPGSTWKIVRKQFGGDEQRVPSRPVPIVPLTRDSYAAPPSSGLRISWLGHSTTLIEIDGHRLLVDPVFSERVSPVQFAGPRRFHPPPLPLAQLPSLDAVIVTHDHYDHLDMDVVRFFASSAEHRATPFVTALGVGAHLERWGIAANQITELDWGETTRVGARGAVAITATPARHFSGRNFTRDRTLWASWAIAGSAHRVFHTGDTGFFDGLAAIGREHGPFDVTLMNIGAYAAEWPEIHATPEEAVRIHELLGGPLLLPIHWGTFNLAFHDWSEPAERLVAAASAASVRIVMPRPGERVEPSNPAPVEAWWRMS